MHRLLLAAALVATVSHAAAAESRTHTRRGARALSIGGLVGSAVVAGVGAGITEYTLTGGRGYTGQYLGLERTGEVMMGIGAASTLITPSLGGLYNGEYLSTGAEMRLGGIGLGLVGGAIGALSSERCQQWGDTCVGGHGPNKVAAGIPIALGAGLYVAGIVHDLAVDAPDSAERYNRRLELAPTVLPSDRGVVPGFGVRATF